MKETLPMDEKYRTGSGHSIKYWMNQKSHFTAGL